MTEGYCTTLAEARCLHKPIIATDITSAKEQIKHGQTGILVKFDADELYLAIKKLIEDSEFRKKLSYNLSLEEVDTKNEINKLLEIIKK